MKKHLSSILVVIITIAVIFAVSTQYFYFSTQTIYEESVSHLTEIYHQSNVSLTAQVNRNWTSLHMWGDYLGDVTDETQVDEFVTKVKAETGFTDFYFINKDGDYITTNDATGYLDLKSVIDKLFTNHEDIVTSSVIPGRPQLLLFASPVKKNTYNGFEFEAIAVSFDNEDMVKTLDMSAFKGKSNSFVIHPDGRIVLDNISEVYPDIYNFYAFLQDSVKIKRENVSNVINLIKEGKHGTSVIEINGIEYYMVYEPAGFGDWIVIGIIPADTVNASMNRLQYVTLMLVTVILTCLGILLFYYILRRNRQKLLEKDTEIEYREELFDQLSINVDDVFLMLDAEEFLVDYVSPNIEKLTGIREEEARADIHVLDGLVKDKNTTLILNELPNIYSGNQGEWDREYIHFKTGEVKWFHVIALCREIKGKKKYILVLSDRSKDKQINTALENAVNAAESANKAKSIFLSNMSHDIRTPMNAIVGFATLASTNTGDEEKIKDYLSKILSSSNHLLSLINDILDMSRIESGKIHLENTQVNLSEVLHDIKTIIGGQIRAKQMELYMDVMDVSDEDVYCDKTRLNQVLLNLLSNAIKFTPSGGTISVRISQLHNSAVDKGLYEIRIKDNGIGMSEEFTKRVFEPFERERNSTVSKIQGTGLGMPITKNIIDMMGGTIEVISEQDKGTEFVIRLELELCSEHKSVEKIKELEGLRALVVDDDFRTCDSVTKMLAKVGMRSEWTLSGREAILRAKQSIEMNDSFHAYIIDWFMPDMNGIEVTRQIRRLGDDTPIIILTAYDWSDIEEEALAAGVTGFCAKPMFMSDLRESLMSALGHKKADNNKKEIDEENKNAFAGRRILLAEDNELNSEIADAILTDYGFSVELAKNGQIALDMIKDSEAGYYDLVLMDIQMPIMNGYETTKKIRELENKELAEIPIIAMTANAFDEDRKQAHDAGMDGFISKPVLIEELLKELRKIFI